MKLLRRHILVLIALGIYWPFLFWLTHIPVPSIARQSGMSDKTMHVLAYFVLTFLVWFSISPYHKVNWTKSKAWFVIAAVVLYGVFDELMQARVGRSADVMDFFANLFGVALALGLLSIFNFWLALLVVSSSFIFLISNMSNLLSQYPQYYLNILFHFTAYAAFALIWMQYLERFGRTRRGHTGWLIVSFVVPLELLAFVKIVGMMMGRNVNWIEVGTSLCGICVALLAMLLLYQSFRKKQFDAAFDTLE